MNENEWLIFRKKVQEGFDNSKEYLRDRFDLQEDATMKLIESFSIENILSFCMDENNFREFSISQRRDFMKYLFELFFSFSKHLLLDFEIYSAKSLPENSPIMENYLKKIPNFQKYLSIMGYSYITDAREWKCVEPVLSPKRRNILINIIIVSCIGSSYIENPLKFISLRIFENRRKSLFKYIEECKCDYCDFELSKENFSCSVCNQGIERMGFFKEWETTYSYSCENVDIRAPSEASALPYESKAYRSLPASIGKTWICAKCTLINDDSLPTCSACMSSKLEEAEIDMKPAETMNVPLSKIIPSDLRFKTAVTKCQSLPPSSAESWRCPKCSLKNPISKGTCNACDFSQDSRWQCRLCTLTNIVSANYCEACLAPKSQDADKGPSYINEHPRYKKAVPVGTELGRGHVQKSRKDTRIAIGDDQSKIASKPYFIKNMYYRITSAISSMWNFFFNQS